MDVFILLLVLSFTVERIACIQNHSLDDLVLQNNATKNTDKVEYYMKISKNCTVRPVSSLVRQDIKQKLDSGVKLIYMQLKFINHTGTLPGEMESDIYKPFHWERITGRHGQGLLFLKTGFEVLSLSTLTLGTETMKIELREDPIGCLLQRDIRDIEMHIRRILLNDFQEISSDGDGGSLNENENVCNIHIKNDTNRAIFYHVCCHKTMKGDIECKELIKDTWIQVLFYCIYFMYFIGIMFCPYLVPKYLYNTKFQTLAYNVHFVEKETIKIRKQSCPKKTNYLDINNLSGMEKFEESVQKLRENEGNLIKCKISDLWLRVEPHRIIPPNDVPVGILDSIYNLFFRCKIRKMKYFDKCCKKNICGPLFEENTIFEKFTWFSCFKTLKFPTTVMLVITPWIIRVLIFYKFENAELETKKEEAIKRNLEVHFAYFPGSLVSFFTPVHSFFIICYAAAFTAPVLFKILGMCRFIERKGIILLKSIKKSIEVIVMTSFTDMNDVSFIEAFGFVFRILLYPFKECGIWAFLFIGVYWAVLLPVCVIVLCFNCFPTLNIIIRLVIYLYVILNPDNNILKIAELPKHSTKCFHFFQFITIFLCLLALISSVILAVEFFVFFLEIMVYTLIGIILNASQTLKFVSLSFMLFLYARECFGSVTKRYQIFNQAINQALLEKAKNEVEYNEVEYKSCQSEDKQQNTAFQFMANQGSGKTTADYSIKDGILKVKIARVLLFLDNEDVPYISRNFFFEIAYKKCKGCPGSLLKNLCQALRQFCIIILFLLFVMVVVMAFGNEYSISGFNQMLATLAGGFLPWIFRNILFKPPHELELDISSVSFTNLLNKVICEHTEDWPVADIAFVDEEQSAENLSNDNQQDVRTESYYENPNAKDTCSSQHGGTTASEDVVIIKTYEEKHKSDENEMLQQTLP